jgi:hypothetical protein
VSTLHPWTPSEFGEKIEGKILYFEHPDGSFTAILRNHRGYYLLPKQAAEIFFMGRPDEASEIEVEYTTAGYRMRSCQRLTSAR